MRNYLGLCRAAGYLGLVVNCLSPDNMSYFSELDFLMACGNHTRQLWAEYHLEYPLSEDEAWRLRARLGILPGQRSDR